MVLSLRRLGGGHRGVGRRANQGPRASPAQRVAWGEDEQGSGARNARQGVLSGADFARTTSRPTHRRTAPHPRHSEAVRPKNPYPSSLGSLRPPTEGGTPFVGRGRARERSEFSPSGGNRAKRTLRGRRELSPKVTEGVFPFCTKTESTDSTACGLRMTKRGRSE